MKRLRDSTRFASCNSSYNKRLQAPLNGMKRLRDRACFTPCNSSRNKRLQVLLNGMKRLQTCPNK